MSALIKPSQLRDAVDGQDLLDSVLAENLDRVRGKVDNRVRETWAAKEKSRMREEYFARAKAAYGQIWAECGKSEVGHDFRQIEVRGFNVNQCDICSAAEVPTLTHDYERDVVYKRVESMNTDQVNALVEEMIAADIRAGLLVWPTKWDYKKKRRWKR